jgi:hypothetical protein
MFRRAFCSELEKDENKKNTDCRFPSDELILVLKINHTVLPDTRSIVANKCEDFFLYRPNFTYLIIDIVDESSIFQNLHAYMYSSEYH